MDYLDPRALGDGARFTTLGINSYCHTLISTRSIDSVKVFPISVGDAEAGGG